MASACREAGFSLIEAVIAMVLFLIVATALSGLMSSGIAAQRLARERTLAEQQALAQIETIRRLPYDSVGTVSGNPPGVVAASTPVSATGLKATMSTQVKYVDDPTPTSYATAANYKKVTVTVTRDRDAKQLIRSVTHVAPPARAPYGGINNAILNTQVVDFALNTPIENANVSLATGPSAPRGDTTDSTGTASFPALTANPLSGPTAYYDITTTVPGYVTLADDVPPGAAAHVQLAPGQTLNTALRVYKPATIQVSVGGWASGGTTTVYVGSSRKAQAFAYTGGTLTITSLGGESVVPGIPYTVSAVRVNGTERQYAPATSQTVPSGYPTNLTSLFSPALPLAPATTRTLTVRVRKGTTLIPGARVDVSGGPAPGYYLTGTTATSGTSKGNVTFTVRQGSSYNVTAWNQAATGTGQAINVIVTANTTITVQVP